METSRPSKPSAAWRCPYPLYHSIPVKAGSRTTVAPRPRWTGNLVMSKALMLITPNDTYLSLRHWHHHAAAAENFENGTGDLAGGRAVVRNAYPGFDCDGHRPVTQRRGAHHRGRVGQDARIVSQHLVDQRERRSHPGIVSNSVLHVELTEL